MLINLFSWRNAPFTARIIQQAAFKFHTPVMAMGNYHYRTFAYHQNVIDHYENPRNVGTLDRNESSVGTGLVGAPACGDVMKL